MLTDLQQNAFVVLGLTPAASNADVLEACEDLSSAAPENESLFTEAKQTLLSPRRRLPAELAFFPDIDDREVRRLLDVVRSGQIDLGFVNAARSHLRPLSLSNLLTHTSQINGLNAELLVALVSAQSAIDPTQVSQALNRLRSAGGVVTADRDVVASELAGLLQRQRSSAFKSNSDPAQLRELVKQATDRIGLNKDSQHLETLGAFLETYWQAIDPTTSRLREQIAESSDTGLESSAINGTVDRIIALLEEWQRFFSPLQALELVKGREHPDASHAFGTIRDLCLKLANNKDRPDAAHKLMLAAKRIFADAPRASERAAQDLQELTELVVHQACAPLAQLVTDAKKDLKAFARSVSATGRIFDQLGAAVAQIGTPHTLPWLIVRDLSITLSNEAQEFDTSLILTNKMIALSQVQAAPAEVVIKLQQDVTDLQREVRGKRLMTLLAEKRWQEASDLVGSMIAATTDPKTRQEYESLKSKIAAKRQNSQALPQALRWLGPLAGVLLFFVVISSIDKKPGGDWPPVHRPTPDFPPPLVDEREVKPPPSSPFSDRTFSRGNIRYCTFEKFRLEHLQRLDLENAVVPSFNSAIVDYNAACGGRFQYLPDDHNAVEAEVRERGALLRSQANDRLRSWREATRTTPPIQPSPPPTPNDPALPSGPTYPSTGVDLLNIETAQRVQRRLIELGYLKSQADGTWGPASRAAMRWFNAVNAVGSTDRVNGRSEGLLFSPSAKPAYGSPPLTSGSTQEEALYPGVNGARLNPLNAADAATIHDRLRSIGLYKGKSNTLWSGTSRSALREFKRRSGLAHDDVWDLGTESLLISGSGAPPANSDTDFESSVGGVWAESPADCRLGRASGRLIVIGRDRASLGQAGCDFQEKSGSAARWEVRAVCRDGAQTWTSNIRFSRTGNALKWESAKGTTVYSLCRS